MGELFYFTQSIKKLVKYIHKMERKISVKCREIRKETTDRTENKGGSREMENLTHEHLDLRQHVLIKPN